MGTEGSPSLLSDGLRQVGDPRVQHCQGDVHGVVLGKARHGVQRNLQGLLFRVAVNACGDQGKAMDRHPWSQARQREVS